MAKWGEIKCPMCEEQEAALAQQDDLVRRMDDARDFPANTCGASRHAAMIAEALCSGDDYPMLAEEPDHCGGSIAATVAALWECRTKLAQQDALVQAAVTAARPPPDRRRTVGGVQGLGRRKKIRLTPHSEAAKKYPRQ
jgi:hypothetical protein